MIQIFFCVVHLRNLYSAAAFILNSKKILTLPGSKSHIKLQSNISHHTTIYLQPHMLTMQLLPKTFNSAFPATSSLSPYAKTHEPPDNLVASSSSSLDVFTHSIRVPSMSSQFSSFIGSLVPSASSPLKSLVQSSDSRSSPSPAPFKNDVHVDVDERARHLEAASVLKEQRAFVYKSLLEATKRRQFDDVKMLERNLKEIDLELSNNHHHPI